MMRAPACCEREYEFKDGRGMCSRCAKDLRRPRKQHTLASAMATADEEVEMNAVGALRLLAWAMRREAPYAGDLRFEQGPAACAALLAGGGAVR